MARILVLAGSTCSLLLASAPLLAEDRDDPPPAVFQSVLDCASITDGTARLACYDATVPKLRDARESKDIVLADREQVREAKRGLFGISLPELKLFSRDKEDEINEIESTIKSIGGDGRGKYVIRLEDGAVWTQTDTRKIYPEVGDSIRIRRGAMGGFLANIDGGIAIRVKRVN